MMANILHGQPTVQTPEQYFIERENSILLMYAVYYMWILLKLTFDTYITI